MYETWLLARLAALPPVVDAVGFSLGAMTLLRIATVQPNTFRHLVLAGIGRGFDEQLTLTGHVWSAVDGDVDGVRTTVTQEQPGDHF